jgi:hypothetical protein
MNKRIYLLVLSAACAIVLAGCASGFTNVAPRAPEKYEKLGKVEGTGCGTMLLLSTAYNFIPVMLNERVEKAYVEALGKAPGSTALTNVTYQESWYWWVIGTTRCVTISGEAIR